MQSYCGATHVPTWMPFVTDVTGELSASNPGQSFDHIERDTSP